MSYQQVQIGDYVDLRQGFAINKNTKKHMSEEPTDLYLLRIGDMKDRNYSVYVKDTIPKHFIADENDIIYTRTGQVGLVFRGQYGVIHNNCFSVSPKDEDVLSRGYLFYALQTKAFYEEANSKASGAAQPDLPHGAFKSIFIPLPEIEVQRKIARILKAYDDLIENNQKQIKLLEEAAQRLYKEWFVDLRFPGYEDVQIVDGVPEGWEKRTLGEVLKVIRGRSYSSKELSDRQGVLMINLSNIRPYGGYNRDQEKRYTGKYTKEQVVKTHDLLMGVTDMTQERRTVGRVAIVPKICEEAMISMDLIKLEPFNGSSLFYYGLLCYGGYSEVVSRFANGTNVLHLRPDVLNIVDVILPTEKLQQRFTSYFENLQDRIDVLQDQILLATEARDRLLPKLMSSEIEL